ncbi:MAG: cytochrome b/b6 domain-containing protein [Burkholderiales bacterium]
MKSIRVWDLPVRLFHWLLVLSIIGLFVTQELGGNWMEWHKRLGFFVIGLILFRFMWGLVGNQHARFLNFVRGPSAVLAYMRDMKNPQTKRYLGHNPMGALSVIAFLLVIGFQAVTGLFADDDIMLSGPYAVAVSKEISDLLTKIHKINSNVIIGLVVLHLGAIGFYFFLKRDNLVKPRIPGQKYLIDEEFETVLPENARPVWLSSICVVVATALTYAIATRWFG